MKLYDVFKNRVILPFKNFKIDITHKNFNIGIQRFFSSFFKGSNIGRKAELKLQKKIIDKLQNEYSDVIEKYKNYKNTEYKNEDLPIWVFWLQGYENAPEIVKKCIDSIKKSTNHCVNIISFDNINDYIQLPEYILEKYKKGYISNTQFADILRMALLSEYGGLWIDATIYIPKKIPQKIFDLEFFTCKRKCNVDTMYVSKMRWTTFLKGCQKGCVIPKAINELFLTYWKTKDYLIDYFLLDNFMLLVYENIPYAKKLIDDLEYNNPEIEELQNRMNDVYNEKNFEDLINGETYFFKLSWRMNFKEKIGDKQTYYGYFINAI